MDSPALLGDKGKQGDDPRPLDRQSQGPLMLCTGSGDPAGKDLTPLGNKTAQYIGVFIVYLELLGTKFADLLLKIDLTLAAATASIVTVSTVLSIKTPILPDGTFILYIFLIRHLKLLMLFLGLR
jgi:hypothetical protein